MQDAEEYALTGSVEFVEEHFKQLYQKAIAYLCVLCRRCSARSPDIRFDQQCGHRCDWFAAAQHCWRACARQSRAAGKHSTALSLSTLHLHCCLCWLQVTRSIPAPPTPFGVSTLYELWQKVKRSYW